MSVVSGLLRMFFVRILSFAALLLAVACTTAPPRHAQGKIRTATISQPPLSQSSGTINNSQERLSVCRMRVSNAPSTTSKGVVVDYQPVAYVRGVSIDRAPVDACLSSGFGPRRGGASSFHHGVDFYTGTPEPIYAGGSGVVEYIGTMRGYGRTIVIRHSNSVKTRYAHLSSYARGIMKGKRISKGQMIGHTGASGNATAVHLHYEVLVDGRRQNPLTVGQ